MARTNHLTIRLSSPPSRNDKLFSIITADDAVRSRVKYEEHSQHPRGVEDLINRRSGQIWPRDNSLD